MKSKLGFIKFDNMKEVEKWLNAKKVTRKINRLQVHHTYLPDYSTWENTDKKVFRAEPELGRTLSLDEYGKNKWNYVDNCGHYIAQHFTIFPNGKITTGRDLNSTPIGIKNWNTGAICVEIYGNFDKDIMTSPQKESTITLYALLCRKFSLQPNDNTIRPHCWFTTSGKYLGNYTSSSAKTCPGTHFMSFGNSHSSFTKNFYPLVKNAMKNSTLESPVFDNCTDENSTLENPALENCTGENSTLENPALENCTGENSTLENHALENGTDQNSTSTKMVKNISSFPLNIHSSLSWTKNIVGTLSPGDSITYISGPHPTSSSTKMYYCKNNTYITASPHYTKIIEIQK